MYDRRRFLRLGGAALAATLAGCTGDGGDGGEGSGSDGDDATDSPTDSDGEMQVDQEITVGPNGALRFDPAEVTVEKGATVRWIWDSDFHTVTPESQPEAADWQGTGTETHNKGYTHTHTFDIAGTYDYYCKPHRSQGMVGTLTVGSGGSGGAEGTPTETDGGGGGGAY